MKPEVGMHNCAFPLPEPVTLKVAALGDAGSAWASGLGETVRGLAEAWGLTIGPVLDGGSAALVLEASTADGTDAVLKIHLPGEYGGVRLLEAARGQGYVAVLRKDDTLGAVLLERLGRPLSSLGLPVESQIRLACETLREAWGAIAPFEDLETGAGKARWLADFIEARWEPFGKGYDRRVLDRALAYAREREGAFSPASSVVVHGDCHEDNFLERLGWETDGGPRLKLVDPEGYLMEPAYDLGLLLRGWNADLLAGDALALGRERLALISDLSGLAPAAIWQWGFIERVSSGLYCLELGWESEGREQMAIAESWASG